MPADMDVSSHTDMANQIGPCSDSKRICTQNAWEIPRSDVNMEPFSPFEFPNGFLESTVPH